ncbi:hypothetical protein [Methanosarcina mazei]|jgi:hypothetical protein|uniref:Uncharacterized protein n=1 Tax=Methanosarcina mazei TaxID=2209 RepID=A0A0F8S7G0_METMZ|nr:hypothetical protein [Methanosarcina mazei]KKG75196.1 hypothetical protein DU46_16935 [Methanosarcina mazei]KKG85835.1 hypothetical protein DU61_15300 [Methanosarcina mazei]KKH05364.1 hypothetical protein DU51_13150 [Methanosarcina mazei]KKH12455.1 hypothetical protein DU62_16780 [Methanosarcina mazei]KKH69234.1 hypothetical protein DU87_03735 [Methanosarcina mazei]
MINEKIHNPTRNSPKTSIVEFILISGPVSEPEIREHLNKMDKSISQATVNRYLHDLAEEPACIELDEPIKKSRSNYWNITKTEHLKNISSCYPDILLKTYEKSINIILQEWGEATISRENLKIYMYLLLSPSLFNECIASGVEALLSREWKMYLCNEGFKKDWNIQKLLNNFYNKYIRNIDFEMSEETFREMWEKTIPNIDEISEEMFLRIFEENFPELSKEMSIETFLEIEEEVKQRMKNSSINSSMFEEYLYEKLEEKFPEWSKVGVPIDMDYEFQKELNNIKNEFSEEILREKIYKKILEEKFLEQLKNKGASIENYRETINKDLAMYKSIAELFFQMKKQLETFKTSASNLLLKHFFNHDILTGIATNEEIEFVKNIKTNHERFIDLAKSNDTKGMIRVELLDDLKYESEIIFKYKKPSYFCDNCSTPEEVYQHLIDFFGVRSLLE